jgi:hypothetical protein
MNILPSLVAAGRVEYQTPYQFGSNLQQVLPSHSNPVSLIVSAYVQNRYDNKDTTASERRVLAVAWQKNKAAHAVGDRAAQAPLVVTSEDMRLRI